jgi:hypothetical protein
VFTGGGVDPDLPQGAVIALLQFAVFISMPASLGDGGLGFTDLILSAPFKTLSSLKNVIPMFDVGDSSFDSHGSVILSVR